jgi:transcription initiation factor IIE alpha subunit
VIKVNEVKQSEYEYRDLHCMKCGERTIISPATDFEGILCYSCGTFYRVYDSEDGYKIQKSLLNRLQKAIAKDKL